MTPFHLKTLGVALLLLVGTGASGGFTGRGDGKASGDPRDFVGQAKIDAAQAIAIGDMTRSCVPAPERKAAYPLGC